MQAKSIDRNFYAYLDFYEKQSGCRLHLNGQAFITEDENEYFINNSNYSKAIMSSLVLIKMKIHQAEFLEGNIVPSISWKDKLIYSLNNLFFSRSSKVYNFG